MFQAGRCFQGRILPPTETNAEGEVRWGRGPLSMFPDWGNIPGTKASRGFECCLQATED